jgi:AAA+ superfamily predicted ATPase
MAHDAWLPFGYKLPDGAKTQVALYEGPGWQILETQGQGRVLLTHEELAQRWFDSGIIDPAAMSEFGYGSNKMYAISSGADQTLCPICECSSPNNKSEALSFALAFKETRLVDEESPLQDALYVEKISRLLPTYSISSRTDDDVVLGYWLTGGANLSVKSFRRLSQAMSWLGAASLKDVVEAAGFEVSEVIPAKRPRPSSPEKTQKRAEETQEVKHETPEQNATFELPGRPELAAFFNEHVIDIIKNRARYPALGFDFPSAVILHGPPGTGKTFAVERLVDFLGWPYFQIDASSVASPYIHETSKKVAEVFDKAIENAPSVLVIDEMEAFLADREMGSGHHRVEEVAEFLRRIPEATKNDVLVVAMTNRIEMIDSAILRRGRFDHLIKVDFASENEVLALLEKLLTALPTESDVDPAPFARQLAGRPLSDVAYVVREGARLAARSGREKLNQESLLTAISATPSRNQDGEEPRRIGFI